MKLYTVYTDQGIFEMTAPLHVIAEMYGLRQEALARIQRESKGDDRCDLHFNGRHRRLHAIQVKESQLVDNSPRKEGL